MGAACGLPACAYIRESGGAAALLLLYDDAASYVPPVCMARGVMRAVQEQLVMLLSKDTASHACLCSSKTSTEQWVQLVLPLLCNDAASYVLSAWHMVSCGHIYRSSL